MTELFCREIDVDYAISVWSSGLAESVLALGMPPSELLGLPKAEFNKSVRAQPLEALDVLSLGNEIEFRAGMTRVPEDVFAQLFALNYGINAAELLQQPNKDREAYILAFGEVPLETIQSLTPYQLNEYYASMANGYSRLIAAARALNAPEKRKGD